MKRKVTIRHRFFKILFCLTIGSMVFTPLSVSAKPSEEKEKSLKESVSPFLRIIDESFYKEVDTEIIFEEVLAEATEKTTSEQFMRAVIKKLEDPFADFFTKEELDLFNSNMKGSFYGIGVTVEKAKSGEVLITEVFDHSPAKKAGLKKGDYIFSVSDQDVTYMELQEVIKLIKGEIDTKVKIDVRRKKEKKSFMVSRGEVIIPSVTMKFYKKNKIGYLQVKEFLDNTDEEFIEKLALLEKKKMKGLIIDLRNNGGGYVDTAHNMLDRVLPDNKVVYSYKYKNNLSSVFRTGINSREDEVVSVPIVILTNQNSASASEIFSGALKDHKAATIVGQKTYGKGVAQSIFESNEGELKGAVKLTVLNYLLPLGESIHKKGIQPDKLVVNKKDKKGKFQDYQLSEALKLLDKNIKKLNKKS